MHVSFFDPIHVDVHCISITVGVRLFFQEAGEPIPSYLMLRASQIEPTGFTGSSPTRALWCQSANIASNNGTWFQPGNTPPDFSQVSTMDIDSPMNEPYQMVTCDNGQVGLIRDTGLTNGASSREGLLQCMIRDENNIAHTLVVGVYTGGVYDSYGKCSTEMYKCIYHVHVVFKILVLSSAHATVMHNNQKFYTNLFLFKLHVHVHCWLTFYIMHFSSAGPMVGSITFALISTRDANPPVFTLTFTSSFGPPTVVTCALNDIALNTSLYTVSREVTRPQYTSSERDMTRVTVTMRTRQSGAYRCSVTVMGRNDASPQQVVTLGNTVNTTTADITGKNIKYTTVLLSSLYCLYL